MAKLLRLRFLNPDEGGNNGTYIEVYCDPNDKRDYFRRQDKSRVVSTDTTTRVNSGKLYEAKLLGHGWRSISKSEMEKNLESINRERAKKGWDPVTLPE